MTNLDLAHDAWSARRWWRACGMLVLALFALVPRSDAQTSLRYVAVLSSFEQQFSPHNVVDAAFRAELTLRSTEPVQFIEVSLPSTQSPAADADTTLAYLKTTFARHKPDLIVSVGGVAAVFARSHRDRIFPQTPMVFASVDQLLMQGSPLNANEAAVASAIDPARLVDNILQVLPETTTLAVLLGSSRTDATWRDTMMRSFERFKDRVTFVWFEGLPFEDILTRSASLPAHSAILFARLGIDARGLPIVEERALPQLRAVANAPIFGVFHSQLGQGAVGGPVIELDKLGRNTAIVAAQILRGEDPRSLTPAPQPLTGPFFDAAELRKWRISDSRLPAGSTVLFRQPTAWQRYRTQIVVTAVIGLGQTALLLGLWTLHVKRRRADRLLQESETRFRELADTAPVMIWRTNTAKKCTDLNHAWLQFTGRTIEQELGDGWAEGIHPGDAGAAWETYVTAFDRREPFRAEYRLRRFDGVYRWVLDTGAPRFTADGSFVGYTGSAVDVTEHKLAKEALSTLSQRLMHAQEEERARIARDLHDEVCPRIIALSVDLGELRQRLPNDDEGMDCALDEMSRKCGALASDVQALSHRLHSSKVELLGLGGAAASFCRELSGQQNVTIQCRHEGVPRHLPPETALGLLRVLQEALMNAVKHSGVRTFEVALWGTDGFVYLNVIDRGNGFDPEDVLKKHGLGLASMRERVGLIGGQLLVQSRPGHGTTISVTVRIVSRPLPFSGKDFAEQLNRIS